jgi:type IV pilus assembly protein PilB
MGVASRLAIRQALADQFGLPWVALAGFAFDGGAVESFPAKLARRHLAMPLYRAGSRLAVALANPVSWEAVEDIESALGVRVDAVLASREDIEGALERHYGPA